MVKYGGNVYYLIDDIPDWKAVREYLKNEGKISKKAFAQIIKDCIALFSKWWMNPKS